MESKSLFMGMEAVLRGVHRVLDWRSEVDYAVVAYAVVVVASSSVMETSMGFSGTTEAAGALRR